MSPRGVPAIVNELRAQSFEMFAFQLPFPPGINHYWRTPHSGPLAGRTLLSKRGREYRIAAQVAILELKVPRLALACPLSVDLLVVPPDRIRRDLDNLPKAILDALTHARVIADDRFIDRLCIERFGLIESPGRVTVTIRPYRRNGSGAEPEGPAPSVPRSTSL